jgi:transcriptional regulator with XRE-family HTH domain
MKKDIQLTFSRETLNQISFSDREIMIPKRLRALREKNNYTMDKVANDIEIKRQTYNGYEAPKGKKYHRSPSFENLIKLAEYYNVSTDYLIGLTDNPAPRIAVLDVEEVIEKSDLNKQTKAFISASLREVKAGIVAAV